MNRIGSNLKKYRRACGYTPGRVAEFAEIETELYRDIEAGRVIPEPELVEKLAGIVRVNPARIYELETQKSGAPTARVEKNGDKAVIRIEWGEDWEWEKGDFFPYDGGIMITLTEVGR